MIPEYLILLLGDESLNESGLNESASDTAQDESEPDNAQETSVEQAQEAVEVLSEFLVD